MDPANPYTSVMPPPPMALPPAEPLPPQPPRIWTVVLVLLASTLSFYVVSVIAFTFAFIWVNGVGPVDQQEIAEALQQVLRSRLGMTVSFVVPQIALAVPALIAAGSSSEPFAQRLALVRGRWPLWGWLAAAMATPLVGLASSLAVGQFMEESEQLKEISELFRAHGRDGFFWPLIAIIGLVPALFEELLFRGYVQTRLTRRLGGWSGVLIASAIFALFHVATGGWVHVVAVFPIGIWLGWLTLRSGSLYPAMIAHLVNNALSVVAIVVDPSDQPDALGLPMLAVTLVILVSGLLGAVGVLAATRQNQETPAAVPAEDVSGYETSR